MNISGRRWESNTHKKYNLIKKKIIGTIHFECYCYARDG